MEQPSLSAAITKKTLTVTGLSGSDKVYDGNTDASATGTGTLSGVVSPNDVSLAGTPVYTFASAAVGTVITITTTGFTLSGTDAGNYTLEQPSLSADITPIAVSFQIVNGVSETDGDLGSYREFIVADPVNAIGLTVASTPSGVNDWEMIIRYRTDSGFTDRVGTVDQVGWYQITISVTAPSSPNYVDLVDGGSVLYVRVVEAPSP